MNKNRFLKKLFMGTWIKKLPKDYWMHPSYCYDDVMLWQNGKVYVMDNHRDAAWCWLQQCKDEEQYNFMHIDKHYDMGDFYYDEDLIPIKENRNMNYQTYANLIRKDGEFKTIRWDNYIRFAFDLRPDWFKSNIFLTHQQGDICEGWHKNNMQLRELDTLFMFFNVNQYLLEISEFLDGVAKGSSNLKWIVNLDLDVFFYHFGDTVHVQLFSDEYIRGIGKLLQKAMDRIQVLTIAMSPDCLCGNGMKEKWDNGFRVLEIMAEDLYALWEFPFPPKYDYSSAKENIG
jgi:hypothetical protein